MLKCGLFLAFYTALSFHLQQTEYLYPLKIHMFETLSTNVIVLGDGTFGR